MTGNKFLLDTNVISAMLKGDISIAEKSVKAEEACISAVVLGEMYYGSAYSQHVDKNLKDIQKVIDIYNVLEIDNATANAYGTIKAALRKKGTPIPENDIWIAATALRHNLVLVTRDKHFKHIEGLDVKRW